MSILADFLEGGMVDGAFFVLKVVARLNKENGGIGMIRDLQEVFLARIDWHDKP